MCFLSSSSHGFFAKNFCEENKCHRNPLPPALSPYPPPSCPLSLTPSLLPSLSLSKRADANLNPAPKPYTPARNPIPNLNLNSPALSLPPSYAGADFADAHQRQQSDTGIANPVDVALS